MSPRERVELRDQLARIERVGPEPYPEDLDATPDVRSSWERYARMNWIQGLIEQYGTDPVSHPVGFPKAYQDFYRQVMSRSSFPLIRPDRSPTGGPAFDMEKAQDVLSLYQQDLARPGELGVLLDTAGLHLQHAASQMSLYGLPRILELARPADLLGKMASTRLLIDAAWQAYRQREGFEVPALNAWRLRSSRVADWAQMVALAGLGSNPLIFVQSVRNLIQRDPNAVDLIEKMAPGLPVIQRIVALIREIEEGGVGVLDSIRGRRLPWRFSEFAHAILDSFADRGRPAAPLIAWRHLDSRNPPRTPNPDLKPRSDPRDIHIFRSRTHLRVRWTETTTAFEVYLFVDDGRRSRIPLVSKRFGAQREVMFPREEKTHYIEFYIPGKLRPVHIVSDRPVSRSAMSFDTYELDLLIKASDLVTRLGANPPSRTGDARWDAFLEQIPSGPISRATLEDLATEMIEQGLDPRNPPEALRRLGRSGR